MQFNKFIRKRLAHIKYMCFKNIYHQNTRMTPENARKILSDAWAKHETSCIRKNKIDATVEYDLQVIVPVYNMEKYIQECMDSIVNQNTKYKFLVCVVNDESTDRSLELLKDYEDRQNVNVVSKPNGGVATARNMGLSEIKARYVMFVDSDDYLEDGCIETLLDKAYEEDADIVSGCHTRLIDGKKVQYSHFNCDQKVEDCKSIPGMPWGKVYKSELFSNIVYPENYWFEDTIIRFLVLNRAKSVYYVNSSVYVYRILSSSASHSNDGDLKNIESYWLTEIIMDDCNNLKVSMDEKVINSLLNQSFLNMHRISGLEREIQEAEFVLTRELLFKYFSAEILNNNTNPIGKYFLKNDFGGYKLYCDAN